MPEESNLCAEIRYLLSVSKRDNDWFDRVAKVLECEFEGAFLLDRLFEGWRSYWGEIEYKMKDHWVWHRPDDGPPIIDGTPTSAHLKIVNFSLKGELIAELRRCGLLTFEEVGYTDNWNKCHIFVDDKYVEKCRSACAILGYCEVLAHGKDGKPLVVEDNLKTKYLQGAVRIVPTYNPQTFF